MGRNRRVKGALAASTAVVCALVLASSAVAGVGASCGLPDDQDRPCSGPVTEGSVVDRSESPVTARRGASSNTPVRETRRLSTIRVGLGAADAVSRQRAGIELAQKDDTPQERTPEEDAAETDTPSDAETPRAPSAERAFEGSPRPAGPDLTLTEERALISSGWE